MPSLAFLRARWFLLALSASVPTVAFFAMAPRIGLHASVPGALIVFLGIGPVLEELVFRGLLQGWLLQQPSVAQRNYAGISLANALTSGVFAAAHLLREPWPWAAATLLPSLVFGVARERSGGVIAPIVLHMAYNGALLAGLLLGL